MSKEQKEEYVYDATIWFIWLAILTIGMIAMWWFSDSTTHHGTLAYWDDQFRRYDEGAERWDCWEYSESKIYANLGLDKVKARLRELECEEHIWKFCEKKRYFEWEHGPRKGIRYLDEAHFSFECIACGAETRKTRDELDCAEKKALRVLGLD